MNQKHTILLVFLLLVAGLSIAFWPWENHVKKAQDANSKLSESEGSLAQTVSERTSSKEKAVDPKNEIQPQQVQLPAGAPVLPYEDPSSEDEVFKAANRERLLGAQEEIIIFIAEIKKNNVSIPSPKQKLLKWGAVLYRDALVAQLLNDEMEPAQMEKLIDELNATQPTIDPEMISEPLPGAEKQYGQYLRQLLSSIKTSGEELTDAQILDLALKVEGLLQRRKRHSDNLYLTQVRDFILDSGRSVAERIAYVERFIEVHDDALASYGNALLADLPERETLSEQDRSAIVTFQAAFRQEKSQ